MNLRPPFVARDVIAGSLELADVLKLNDQELPDCGDVRPSRGRARGGGGTGTSLRIVDGGPDSRGRGSLLLADGRWSEHPGIPAEVCDTIGAGDAFTAALTVGLLAGRPLEAINRHANQVAAFVCSRPGGTRPSPTR